MFAIALLAKRPDLLDHVIIDGAGVLPLPGLPLMKIGFFILQPFLHTNFAIKTIAQSMKIPEKDFKDFRKKMLLISPSSFRRSFIQTLSLRQPSGLDKLENTVLFVAGEKEPDAVKRSNAMIARIMPNAEVRIAPNMGHGWLAEATELHYRMVKAWFEDRKLPEELIAASQ